MWAATAEGLAREHPSVDAAAVRERFLALRDPMYAKVLSGEFTLDDYRREHLLGALEPWAVASDALLAEHGALRAGMIDDVAAMEGALALVDRVRAAGLRAGLLTNGPSAMQRRKLELLGLTDRLDGIGISAELGAAKPDPAAYAGAAAAVGLAPERLAMVGDHLEWDVAGPLRAGYAAAVWLARDGRPAGAAVPAGATVVRTLAEVPAALGL